jgi:hypothetical protein
VAAHTLIFTTLPRRTMDFGLRHAVYLLLALAVAVVAVFLRGRKVRERRLREVLDQADAVQALLEQASERMAAWRGAVGRLAGDLGHGAEKALDSEPLIREAKRDLLQHRLWIQSHGEQASRHELDTALAALQRAHARLARQLSELEAAGDALTQATDAAHEAARREPASLRRPPETPDAQP